MSNSTVLITGALTGIGCATAMAFAKERAPSVSTLNDGARTHGPAAASGINVILSRNGQSAPAAHETQSKWVSFRWTRRSAPTSDLTVARRKRQCV
jgi:NAD(P)-dependent dehydrogenase (short-subunit alcohol dehydrogenase family)